MNCQHCGKELVRKQFAGRMESSHNFSRRKYCDRECQLAEIRKPVVITTEQRNEALRAWR